MDSVQTQTLSIKGNGYKVYVTYEEALEAGLQEALKLI